MRNLFYDMVENIVEYLTGIENGAIKLWELHTYVTMCENVAIWLNIVIAAVIIACIFGVVSVNRFFHYKFKEEH